MKIELGAITLNEVTLEAIMAEIDKAMVSFKVDEKDRPCYPSRYGFSKAVIYRACEQIIKLQTEIEILRMKLESIQQQSEE